MKDNRPATNRVGQKKFCSPFFFFFGEGVDAEKSCKKSAADAQNVTAFKGIEPHDITEV